MWLRLEHVTTFSYDGPISEAYTELRLKPAHRDGQRCSAFALTTEPRAASVHEYRDRFGNSVHHFDILEAHDELVVTARSEVWTPARFEPGEGSPSQLDRHDFLAPSRYVPLDGAIAELADSVEAGDDALGTATRLMEELRRRITYERGSTHVHTRADEALADGRGVCQDFAHVFIGACRVKGIAARYVSGYLDNPGSNGDETATHAWVDVWVDGTHWVPLDPTHDREQTEDYIRVGVGRDYADVPPTRGVYKGSANEELEVTVRTGET